MLKKLGEHYHLPRVADVDMGLWSAAHLSFEYPGITEQMYQDDFFQEVQIDNMLEGLGNVWKRTKRSDTADRQHLLFARSLLRHDHLAAALLTGRVYESLLFALSERWGVEPGILKRNQTKAAALVDRLGKGRELDRLGTSPEDLKRWWSWRNDAVHSERMISKQDSKSFVQEVSIFYSKCYSTR